MRIALFFIVFYSRIFYFKLKRLSGTQKRSTFHVFFRLGVLAELFSATPAPYECTTPSRLQQFDVLESTESGTSLRA